MKNSIFSLLFVTALLLVSCSNQPQNATSTPNRPAAVDTKPATIPYTEAENYFLRNDATLPNNPKINTQEQFDSLFGMAATMGENGLPTDIDFDRQFVIAVALPVTNRDVEIDDERLLDDGQSLTLEYSVDVDDEVRSFEIQPLLLIVVDRQYERETVTLRQVAED